MVAARVVVEKAEPRMIGNSPGDTPLFAENLLAGTIAGAGTQTWTAKAIVNGLIYRTGPAGAYADVTDTAAAIVAALTGNGFGPDALPGSSWRMRFFNTVAFANTPTFGAGVVAGTGTTSVAASLWRDYLFTILNSQPVFVAPANTTNGSAVVTFVFPTGRTVYKYPVVGDNTNYATVGATVTGTGITAGTTVIGVTAGQGGFSGVTLSANATATSIAGGVPLTFGPTIQLDSLGSGTL